MPAFDPFDPRTWSAQDRERLPNVPKTNRGRHTETALANLELAVQDIRNALDALRNPDYFDDQPDPNFELWDDRVSAWRQDLGMGSYFAADALRALVAAANFENVSPPKPKRRRSKRQ